MARFTTVTFTTASVSASASVNHNQVLGDNFINVYKIKIVPSIAGGTTTAQVYTLDSFLTANLIWGTNPFAGTFFDPIQQDAAGTITEADVGFLFPYEDGDTTGEFHIKITNNDTSTKTYTVTLIYEEVATFSGDDLQLDGNLFWKSGTAYVGTFDHAITAARAWTFPDVAGTVVTTGNLTDITAVGVLAGGSPLVFEGATANAYETTLAITDPTADRTITFPDATGTVFLLGGTDLTVADGGTGASTFTDGGVLLGSGTGAITATAVLGDGVILIGDASGDPTTLDVGSSTGITILGTVATGVWQGTDVGVAYGGTGVSTLTDGGVLLGSGASAITAMAVLTDSQMIVGNGTGDPVAESGATLRTSIGVGTGDSPTFTGLVVGQVIVGTDGATAGDVVVDNTNNGEIIWEGSTADGNENKLRATDGAGVNTLPASTGTILTTAAAVSVAQGGTGATSLTDGGILLGSGTGAITALGVAANGQIPIGDGSTDPQLATLTGTANEVAVTNGGGSITLSIPDASIFVTPRATGVAEFNDTVLIGANGTSLDGHVHILSPSTSVDGLIVEVPASGSTAFHIHYDGSEVFQIQGRAAASKAFFSGRDLGNDVSGPMFQAERNTHSGGVGPCASIVATQRASGTWGFRWVDNTGDYRIHTGSPTGSTGSPSTSDTAGVIIGSQSSPEFIKNISHHYGTAPNVRSYEKLQAVLDVPIKDFTFKSGKHFGQVFTGIAIPDGEHPWYGMDPVQGADDIAPIGTAKALNEMNLFGYLILSIQALNKKIKDLEKRLN